jgi:hypothetical protein
MNKDFQTAMIRWPIYQCFDRNMVVLGAVYKNIIDDSIGVILNYCGEVNY